MDGITDVVHSVANPVPPPALMQFMASGWLDTPPRAIELNPQVARLRSRREVLSRAFPGQYLVIDSGKEQVRSGGSPCRFRPSSNFVYLAGQSDPGAVLVLEPDGGAHHTRLFVPEYSRDKSEIFRKGRYNSELWVGERRSVAESQSYYGVDVCEPLGRLTPYLESLRGRGCSVRMTGENVSLPVDFEVDPGLTIYLSEMRLIKDEYEHSELRKGAEITKRAF